MKSTLKPARGSLQPSITGPSGPVSATLPASRADVRSGRPSETRPTMELAMGIVGSESPAFLRGGWGESQPFWAFAYSRPGEPAGASTI
jgi:hypothetical protein